MDNRYYQERIQKHKNLDVFVTGFALFAMFFGAGNLIFPPELGVLSGEDWFFSFLGFFFADAGLATLSMFAMLRNGGDIHNITGTLGSVPGKVLALIVVLCIGPCIAIPRTGTVTFSLGIIPITGIEPNNSAALAIFSIGFFFLVYLLSVTKARVVSIVGKILTPLLLICLVILIATGIVISGGFPSGLPISDNCVRDGVFNGYQTMDALAALIFATIIINSLRAKGFNTNASEGRRQLGKCSLLACGILGIIYGGLTFLGGVFGREWGMDIANKNIDQAQLLIAIVEKIMGEAGKYVISVIVLFACLTTAIGLCSSISEYFVKVTHGRIKYKTLVVIMCLAGAALCNFGLSEIIALASPILSLVYPLVMVLIILSLFNSLLVTRYPHILGGAVALIFGMLDMLRITFEFKGLEWEMNLPFSAYGFNWAVPAIVAIAIGLIFEFVYRKKHPEDKECIRDKIIKARDAEKKFINEEDRKKTIVVHLDEDDETEK